MKKKITIIGAGAVGSTLAQRILERNYADVVMFDIVPNMPMGKALDMQQTGAILGYCGSIVGTNDYRDTAKSDIVVITSGFPRKPGMTSRNELLEKNQQIVTQVTQNVVKYSPNCIIIVVTNPLNAMAQVAFTVSKFPKERVLGMAGVLDTARFRAFVAQELSVSREDVQACILGEHGDSMVPVLSQCTIAGIPISQLLSNKRINQLVERARNGGGEIVKLLGIGSTYFAPSAAILRMIDAIMLDTKEILPCAVYLQGEYGIKNLFFGVPVKLGAKGVEQIIELKLNKKEQKQLQKSADSIRGVVRIMKEM